MYDRHQWMIAPDFSIDFSTSQTKSGEFGVLS